MLSGMQPKVAIMLRMMWLPVPAPINSKRFKCQTESHITWNVMATLVCLQNHKSLHALNGSQEQIRRIVCSGINTIGTHTDGTRQS